MSGTLTIPSRRRFLGLLAAPAIVSITGKVHAALPPPDEGWFWFLPGIHGERFIQVRPTKLIVPPHLEFLVEDFRERLEVISAQVLNEAFDKIDS